MLLILAMVISYVMLMIMVIVHFLRLSHVVAMEMSRVMSLCNDQNCHDIGHGNGGMIMSN